MERKGRSIIDHLLIVLISVLIGANLWIAGREWFPKELPPQSDWFKEVMEAIRKKPFGK